jgi:hypothetical protein
VSVVVMPVLAKAKRRVAAGIGSAGDGPDHCERRGGRNPGQGVLRRL